MRTRTLGNGLRLQIVHVPGALRTGVALHYGVGFRSERPGQEGLAHLFEHLMFRGSASLPDGRFYDHIKRWGGAANGTTHQDYTDYYQVTPLVALEAALFAEADRMRSPRFTAAGLAEQIEGVGTEIDEALRGRPYGGFPWPLLPSVLFDGHADAHDGYGEPSRLAEVTLDRVEDFFDTHYTPGNAVLTVAGDVDADHVEALVERHFGDIPGGADVPRRAVAETPAPVTDRRLTTTRPGIPLTALAVGHPLAGPEQDLEGYLAHLVLGRITARHGARLGLHSLSASCGFFGAFDARTPDVLITAGLLAPGREPDRVTDDLRALWRTLGEPDAVAGAVRHVVPLLVAEHHRKHADIGEHARALGRFALLFDDPGLLDRIPAALAALTPETVAGAARRLATRPHAAVVMAPAVVTPRPRPGARPLPAPGPQLTPDLGPVRDRVLPRGLHVVAAPDGRAPLAEARLRLPVGDHDPATVGGWVRSAATRAPLAERLGGALTVTADAHWLDLSAHAPRDRAADLLELFATVLDTPAGPASAPTLASPEHEMDTVLRRHWLGAPGPGPFVPPLSAGVLTVVGADPSAVLDAAAVLDRADAVPAPRPGAARPGTLALSRAGATRVHITVSVAEPDDGPSEAARFLAAAVVGGGPDARVPARATLGDYHARTGRDLVGTFARAYVRAECAPDQLAGALADLAAERQRLHDEPLTAAEIDPLREYCAAQLLAAFDSPATLADLLSTLVSGGRDARWLQQLPGLLGKVPAEEVAEAARILYGSTESCIVVSGPAESVRVLSPAFEGAER
ncbi:M16 family metallopeptidase [Actinoplanes philippinensis]|uniref:M16 family metallopeptidase n=1 Tax=Actinoplanes philippinensis TaxID=35752 RepID=UPI0033D1BB5C